MLLNWAHYCVSTKVLSYSRLHYCQILCSVCNHGDFSAALSVCLSLSLSLRQTHYAKGVGLFGKWWGLKFSQASLTADTQYYTTHLLHPLHKAHYASLIRLHYLIMLQNICYERLGLKSPDNDDINSEVCKLTKTHSYSS